jgi:hypothetical protein
MNVRFSAQGALIVLSLAVVLPSLRAASSGGTTPAIQTPQADPGWPRQYTDGSAKLVVYQPQIDSWKNFRRIEGRFAVALTPRKGGQTYYGAVHVEADTAVDVESRTVVFTRFAMAESSYTALPDPASQEVAALTERLFPKAATSVSLDRILAYMDTAQIKPRQIAISLEAPAILVSTQPAVLVIIDGDPVPFDLEGTSLQKIVNTNWDLFFDKDGKRYYLRNGRGWLSAQGLNEGWKSEKKLPRDFLKLPSTEPYREIKLTAEAPQKQPPLLVLVVHKPTELIVVNGPASVQRVPGTQLMWVANTECDVFYHSEGRSFYFLTSGRWFRNPDLASGQWAPATSSLPDDFKKIPLNHPRAHVLASVQGTRQADDAVLAASIPRTAAIDRKNAKAEVQYVREPKFEPIAGTKVSYAVNTPNDVLMVGESYYLCLQGVWFVSSTPVGPWAAADRVPDEIYEIPPESPKHNVTYVSIYEATPDTVVYGYTAGYEGLYVGYGVPMWGTGYFYPPYYGWSYYGYPVYWPASYYTYGAAAWYNPATGGYARGSAVYGPYGGYGRAAAYNPSTGGYSWGRAAWGPYGAAASGGFYNPATKTWGGSYHASNGYQSWGQSVAGRGDQWARTASYSDSRGTVGAAKTAGGGKAIAARGSEGQGFLARTGAGDVYAGRDGNVYKLDGASGQWSRNNGGSWESAGRPSPDGARVRSGGQETIQGLNRDAAARSQGNLNTQRSVSNRQAGSFAAPSRSGGGFAARGGGRRR